MADGQKYESTVFSNISASTATFFIEGGYYGLDMHATWGGGSVTLQRLAADLVTWNTAMSAFTVDGTANGLLPTGNYRFLVATATGIYIQLTRCPIG